MSVMHFSNQDRGGFFEIIQDEAPLQDVRPVISTTQRTNPTTM